jgi:hypothetical protein
MTLIIVNGIQSGPVRDVAVLSSVPAWLAAFVPVLPAAVAGGLALLGIIVKNRWDARTTAREARETRAAAQAEWVLERRERVYVGLLNAIKNYANSASVSPGFQEAGQKFTLVAWPRAPEAERSAWQELKDAVADIQPFGSRAVREASADLLDLQATVRERLVGNARKKRIDDADGEELRGLGEDIRVQRRRVADLIRKELGVDH